MLADHPWWAPAASAIKKTATHAFEVRAASMMGVTASAHANIAVLRLAFTVHPLFSSHDESHPPLTLPTLAPL